MSQRPGHRKWPPSSPNVRRLTCHLVHQDAGGDDASVLGEELLQLLLGHGFGQAADVQVGVSDGGGARTRIGNLGKRKQDVSC